MINVTSCVQSVLHLQPHTLGERDFKHVWLQVEDTLNKKIQRGADFMNHGVHCSHYNRRHMIVRYIGIYYLFIESTNILVVVVDVPVYCVLHNND